MEPRYFDRIGFLHGYSQPEFWASGSSGVVYRISRDGKNYALKVIDCGQDAEKIRNAEYEIFLLQRLRDCRNIVHLIDSETVHTEDSTVIFLLEPFVTTFEEYYKSKDMTVADVLQLGIDICDALDYCWDMGVAHLDIQPKNLFVDADGRFLLGDFGAGVPLELLKQERQLRGTLSYMAPEVYEKREYTQASDIYALGMVLYCLLNRGNLPFMERGLKEKAVMTRLIQKVPVPSLQQNLLLERLFQQVLAVDARQRYQSFWMMRNALMAIREQMNPQELDTCVKPAPAGERSSVKTKILDGLLRRIQSKNKQSRPLTGSSADSGDTEVLFAENLSDIMMTPVRCAPADWKKPAEHGITEDMSAVASETLFDADPYACTVPLAASGGSLFDSFTTTCTPSAATSGNLFDSDSFACTCAMRASVSGDKWSADSAELEFAPDCTAAPRMSQVQFSAVAPKEARKEDYAIIQLFMYEQAFRAVVEDAIATAESPVQEKRSGFQRVRENTKVKVLLTCPDMPIEDNVQEQIWYGGYLRFDFAICPPEDLKKRQILLTAAVYFDDVPATRLLLAIKALASYEEEIKLARQDIITAFVSYASQDRTRVGALVQGMRKARPDMDIFFDVATLRSGQNWEEVLYQEILRRDILFLCWSRNAQSSDWVEREWRYALEHKGIAAIEPIPLEQPDICPPPSELRSKHFNDSLLYIINR